jgi:N-acetylglutamate synthase-like GNAT family acetyltransferase
MKIRAVRSEDYASVVDLVTTVLAEYGFSAHIGGVQRDLEGIEDGKVVGTVAIRPKQELTCELKRLYVSKHARGHGIGR